MAASLRSCMLNFKPQKCMHFIAGKSKGATRSVGLCVVVKKTIQPSLPPTCTHRNYHTSLPQIKHFSARYLSCNAINYYSIDNDNNISQHEINTNGEECYQLALEALKNASKARQKREERLLQEQFEAMDRQRKRTQQRRSGRQDDPRLQRLNAKVNDSEEDSKDRAAGVAVVRTIVKQSQPNVHVDKSIDEEHWQQVAQKHLEEAAFRYGHCLALVRLGNEALERASSSSSTDSLIDQERCKQWINESQINLAAMLELSRNGDGNSDSHDFADGKPLSPPLRLALHLYQAGGKQGSAEGWFNCGHLLWEHQNHEKAMEAFHKAMELGDADAFYFVAARYLSYEESEDDGGNASILLKTYNQCGPASTSLLQSQQASALPSTTEQREMPSLTNDLQRHGYTLLHFAANQHNHGSALHHLALLHNQNGNDKEFRDLLHKAAATGNPDSLFLQGHCYYSDDQNFPAALENFLAAAENGHVDAMVSAGAMLHQGVISNGSVLIERDQQRAFELYQQAGELGSVEGWRNVISCYATGEGVPQCLETAKYIANTMLKDDK